MNRHEATLSLEVIQPLVKQRKLTSRQLQLRSMGAAAGAL
jgi:hypothetical protein